MPKPVWMAWDGETLTPVNRLQLLRARDQFIVDRHYLVAEVEERSEVSHKHEFAWLREAHANLPEGMADQYPTPDALRKRALIEGGFYNEQVIEAGSPAAALQVAAFARQKDEFALVIVRDCWVFIRTAKSQARNAMNKEDFQRSKDAILEIVAALIGVTPESLSKAQSA